MIKKHKGMLLTVATVIVIIIGICGIYLWNQESKIVYLKQEQNQGNTIYSTTFNKRKAIYVEDTSRQIKAELEQLFTKNRSFKEPLWAYNPFGTNLSAYYLAFHTKESSYLKYTISVADEAVPDFSRVAYVTGGDKVTQKHEYQLVGFVPGMTNTVKLELYSKEDMLLEESVTQIDVPAFTTLEETIFSYEDGESQTELSDGLYALCIIKGDNDEPNYSIGIYDNEGILRSKMPLIKFYASAIEQIDGNLFYAIEKNLFATVSPLGQVLKVYDLGQYNYHHDYVYLKEKNQMWMLATDTTKEKFIEDVIVALDLESGEIVEVIDFEQFDELKSIANAAVANGNPDEIDWIHFNSITFVDEDSMVLSARELSAVVKISNIFDTAKLEYIIADSFIFEGTDAEELLYTTKEVDASFKPQYGQHTIVYHTDDSLPEGSYYLSMFDNNAGWSHSRPELDWSHLSNVGKTLAGKNEEHVVSYYYRYLVDETNKTYELVDSFAVPYSGVMSSAQVYNNNIITNSSMARVYGEYDAQGQLIRQFKLREGAHAYRGLKYSFNNIWFQ